ncbi:hypothetical protein [Treponema porcinum]|uniref:hypothetical protein n=1 Tax=Treponema porcinum TaxID=261392 RepID=UPI0023524E0B|nr:hypothetical protein [Treponema porcinum]MCI6481911.1 hypothetical protein [Treponema porcinum]MDY5817316.1 hypothetical protein [Treponema sp.]
MAKEQNPFEIDFDTYILQSEPSKQERGKLWQTAIGLQQVDGLTPSKYLMLFFAAVCSAHCFIVTRISVDGLKKLRKH